MASKAPAILLNLVRRSKAAVKKIDYETLEQQIAETPKKLTNIEEDAASLASSSAAPTPAPGRETPVPAPTPGVTTEVGQETPTTEVGAAAAATAAAAAAARAAPRLDTIKLSAQVAREQIDAHGGESVLLRQQVLRDTSWVLISRCTICGGCVSSRRRGSRHCSASSNRISKRLLDSNSCRHVYFPETNLFGFHR
jgi:hypothetical protein